MSEPVQLRQHGNAAVAMPLDALLAARTVWRAGQGRATVNGGESTGHAALDALLPDGGWPRRALTELLLPAHGIGEIALLLPTLARMTARGSRVVLVAPPFIPYAPAWQAGGWCSSIWKWCRPSRAQRYGRSNNACAAAHAPRCWAGRRPAMRVRCAACRWRPIAATAAPSHCAIAAMR